MVLLSSADVACAQSQNPSGHAESGRKPKVVASPLPMLSFAAYETMDVSSEDVYLPKPIVGESESAIPVGVFKRLGPIDIEAKVPHLRELSESEEEYTPFFPEGMAFLIISMGDNPSTPSGNVIVIGYQAEEKRRERFLFAAGRSLGLRYAYKSSEFASSKNRKVLKLLDEIDRIAAREKKNRDDQKKSSSSR
jgi:hypothetical protein